MKPKIWTALNDTHLSNNGLVAVDGEISADALEMPVLLITGTVKQKSSIKSSASLTSSPVTGKNQQDYQVVQHFWLF